MKFKVLSTWDGSYLRFSNQRFYVSVAYTTQWHIGLFWWSMQGETVNTNIKFPSHTPPLWAFFGHSRIYSITKRSSGHRKASWCNLHQFNQENESGSFLSSQSCCCNNGMFTCSWSVIIWIDTHLSIALTVKPLAHGIMQHPQRGNSATAIIRPASMGITKAFYLANTESDQSNILVSTSEFSASSSRSERIPSSTGVTEPSGASVCVCPSCFLSLASVPPPSLWWEAKHRIYQINKIWKWFHILQINMEVHWI